jgi:hypothetical protein
MAARALGAFMQARHGLRCTLLRLQAVEHSELRVHVHVGQGRISEVESMRQEYDASRKEVRAQQHQVAVFSCRLARRQWEFPRSSANTKRAVSVGILDLTRHLRRHAT